MAMEEKKTAARTNTIIEAGPILSVLFSKVTAKCYKKFNRQ
jgi:hypothetical protein